MYTVYIENMYTASVTILFAFAGQIAFCQKKILCEPRHFKMIKEGKAIEFLTASNAIDFIK